VMFATKNLKARCDVALQPLWRYVKERHRSCDDTWSSATNLKKYSFLFSLVAKLHMSSQLRWRYLTYHHRCCRATSRMGAHSSEAWFIYLTFRYRDCGMLLHFVLTATFFKFVYIVYFFPAFSQRMYDMNG
jgi:hypothetical protein